MLSQRVILRAFGYEGVVWSVQSRRWKPITRERIFVVSRWKLGRSEGPRHTPVQQGRREPRVPNFISYYCCRYHYYIIFVIITFTFRTRFVL